MKKIEAYKTSDNRLFECEYDAKLHEMELKVKQAVHYLCEFHGYRDMSVSDMADIMLEHQEDFLKALRGEFVVPKNKVEAN